MANDVIGEDIQDGDDERPIVEHHVDLYDIEKPVTVEDYKREQEKQQQFQGQRGINIIRQNIAKHRYKMEQKQKQEQKKNKTVTSIQDANECYLEDSDSNVDENKLMTKIKEDVNNEIMLSDGITSQFYSKQFSPEKSLAKLK